MEKILVIGSLGFIGGHCLKSLKENGYALYGCDIHKSSTPGYFVINETAPDYDSVFSSSSFDVCINASGSASVAYSFENQQLDYKLNVLNVEAIIKSILKFSPLCRFINLSSAAVYGNPKKLPIKENSILQPISPYGRHKLESEKLLREYYVSHKLKACSLRIFSAYGPGLKKQLFWDIYQKLLISPDNTIKLFGTGEETRDFIFIGDIMNAIEKVIENATFLGESINVASGSEVSIYTAATSLITHLHKKVHIEFMGKPKEGDPQNWVADISELSNLGFKPSVTFDEGIKQYAQWLNGNK